MKRLFFTMVPALFLVLNAWSQDQPTQVKQSNEPYKALVKNVAFGNSAYSQMALQFWKDYDMNTLENSMANFSDNCKVYIADGTIVNGKENWYKALTAYRNGFSNVNSNALVCTTLKSPDNPDYEVTVIWGTSKETKNDGSVQNIYVHEIFTINKDGKIQEFRHLFAVLPKE